MPTKIELLENLTVRELRQLLKEGQITLVKKRFLGKETTITKKEEIVEALDKIPTITKEKILALSESKNNNEQKIERKTVRRTIPKSVKDSVWNSNIGQDKPYGNCFICGKPIHIQDFDVGHNKAVTKGGTDNISNLKPICRTCNTSMGTMSIEAYKKRYFSKKELAEVTVSLLVSTSEEKHEPKIEKKDKKLKPFEGTVELLKIATGEKLYLTMPHKPEEASMSFTIDSLFTPYLNKAVKITIEELEKSY